MAKNNVIAINVRRARVKAKLSQRQLAFRAGLVPSYINLIEAGERNPTVATLERLAKVLKVKVPTLLAR